MEDQLIVIQAGGGTQEWEESARLEPLEEAPGPDSYNITLEQPGAMLPGKNPLVVPSGSGGGQESLVEFGRMGRKGGGN